MGAIATTAAQAADLQVTFGDPAWDGKKIPKGQQCTKFGGKGATPALRVENIPAGANAVIVEFNDRNYQPLSWNGGHGKIGFWISEGASSAMLPSVPGETGNLPEGSFVEKRNRATGGYARPGYLPPCSGRPRPQVLRRSEGREEGRRKEKSRRCSRRPRFSWAGTDSPASWYRLHEPAGSAQSGDFRSAPTRQAPHALELRQNEACQPESRTTSASAPLQWPGSKDRIAPRRYAPNSVGCCQYKARSTCRPFGLDAHRHPGEPPGPPSFARWNL